MIIVGELDGKGEDAEDELVFDDDVLTWRDVASTTKAAEPLKYIRKQSKWQRKGKRVVEEKDEDESSQDEGEKECNSSCNESDEDNDMEVEEDEEDY
ncbi:hypothetical protein CR513_55669, partial [Mucuna pruriens]